MEEKDRRHKVVQSIADSDCRVYNYWTKFDGTREERGKEKERKKEKKRRKRKQRCTGWTRPDTGQDRRSERIAEQRLEREDAE